MIHSSNVLIIHNTPYKMAARVITRCQKSLFPDRPTTWTAHHCAICLGDMVYEAHPPRVRKMSIGDYVQQIKDWNAKQPKCRCEVYEPPVPYDVSYVKEHAKKELGIRYGMIFNYLFGLPSTHCSEFLASKLDLISWFRWHWSEDDFSRITPAEVMIALLNNQFVYKDTIR